MKAEYTIKVIPNTNWKESDSVEVIITLACEDGQKIVFNGFVKKQA